VKGLIKYTLTIVLVLIGIEVFVSHNQTYFKALSDKLLLKLEMLKKREDDQLVFIGSSKSLDAIDGELFNDLFNKASPQRLKSFNMATAGQNKSRFFYTIQKVLHSPVKILIIEISDVNFIKGDLRFSNDSELNQNLENQPLEDKLTSMLHDHLNIVKYRKAFKPKAILRLFMIFTSNVFNHDMWFRSNTIKQIISKLQPIPNFDPLKLIDPKVIDSRSFGDDKFIDLIEILKKSNKKIIFINPPVAAKVVERECSNKNHLSYKSLSSELNTKVYDYSCTGLNKEFLRDPIHLNALGRKAFTKILVRDLRVEIEEGL